MTATQLTLEKFFSQSGPHGHQSETFTGYYQKGCRCEECKIARRKYTKIYRADKLSKNPDYLREMEKKYWPPEKRRASTRIAQKKIRMNHEFRAKECRESRLKAIAFREFVSEIKIRSGCAECGYKNHPSALDFDHVRGIKHRQISHMGTYSKDKIEAELAKTEIVCCCCHRIRTIRRQAEARKLKAKKPLTKDRQYANKAEKRGREFLTQIKMSTGCVDCGYRKAPEALDFDHVFGEKSYNVGMRISVTPETLKKEIAKCEVVCANCHRIRTYERHQARKAKRESVECH